MSRSKCPTKWMTAAFGLGLAMLFLFAAPVKAQLRLDGTVLDAEGKPFPGVKVIAKDEQGRNVEGVTDQKGNFMLLNLRPGIYILTFKNKPKEGPEQQIYEMNTRVSSDGDNRVTVNFKEIVAKQGAAAAEELKKQEEARGKFETMKGHFDLGVAAMQQAKQAETEWKKAAADQKAPLQEKMTGFQQTAITEFQTAEKAAGEKEANLHLVLANLASAYLSASKWAEAADAYQRAINLKPDQANYYADMGTAYARLGKAAEANAACEKAGQLDPPNAALCWRNLGIVLYNKGSHKEAVEVLKKATAMDPNNPQGWYVLGASLVGIADYKKEGEKYVVTLQPGTVEAYQKVIELDPNGPWGAQAKDGLVQLQAMGAGISTSMGKKKK